MNARRHAPATQRNREVIAGVLRHELPANGLILEVASGSGEHVVHFAELFPALEWQPSDADALARESISAWQDEADLPNLHQPLDLDAAAPDWPLGHANAILCVNKDYNSCVPVKSVGYAACICINMVHISKWAATVGLFKGCAKVLQAGAPLILYDPYFRDAVETAPSNLAFDIDLRSRNPEWGLRHLEEVDHEAMAHGFEPTRLVEMLANNIIRVYRKR
ncbi:MAG TPA: DUF938 domain-containing protein [Sphingobium sp.]